MSQSQELEPGPPLPPPPESYPVPVHKDVRKQHYRDLAALAFWFRVLCAFTCLTFFQPDEYFQSLEPAWRVVFGPNSGAWITWEWDHRLRSSLHPMLITAVYKVTSAFLWTIGFPFSIRTSAMVVAPRLFHATCTAVTDYATWRLAARIFGSESSETTAALILSFLSPWHWFAGPRSLTNNLEACLTTVALVHWPWSWIIKGRMAKERAIEVESIGYAVFFAATSCVLRPTNTIIWASLLCTLLPHISTFELKRLLGSALVYGPMVLTMSLVVDRLYYGVWAFPALQFLYFNLTRDVAVFYGANRIDYYFTEGLPILLTVALPFAVIGLYQSLTHRTSTSNIDVRDNEINSTTAGASHQPISPEASSLALHSLAVPVVTYPIILSLISHKEVRFLYPLLAPLFVVAARPFATFFDPVPWPTEGSRKYLMVAFGLGAVVIAGYTSTVHQQGPAFLLSYLREQFIYHNSDALVYGRTAFQTAFGFVLGHQSLFAAVSAWATRLQGGEPPALSPLKPLSAAFLMPCHSTPWRSHLSFPELHAWALTCEPPVSLTQAERASYVDEADVFYADPVSWLQKNMGPIPKKGDVVPWQDAGLDWRTIAPTVQRGGTVVRPWPRYLAFFEQLEPTIKAVLGADSQYTECWRGFNTHVHDDWRRKGDMVVYCIGGSIDPTDVRESMEEAKTREWEEGQLRSIEEQEALKDEL